MPLTQSQILSMLETSIQRYTGSEGTVNRVGWARLVRLREIRDHILRHGFPIKSREDKLNLSLVPYVFQECNYDDEDWFDPKETLVKDLLDLDFYVAFDGKERKDVNRDEFHSYAMDAIDRSRN
jgi:hypothetical protein